MILFDTSALAKLLVEEEESAAVEELIRAVRVAHECAISTIAVTELRRLGVQLTLDERSIGLVANLFRVLALTEGILQLAGRLPYRNLGTLDAIHVSTALSAGVSALVTYDQRTSEAAAGEGLQVLRPGR